MSTPCSASIVIGGDLPAERVEELLGPVREARAARDWGESILEPRSAEELMAAVRDRRFWLCSQSCAGDFPVLETTCRELGLSYSRWTEGFCDSDAEIVDWRPGMGAPLVRIGSNHCAAIYVDAELVGRALRHLEVGRLEGAIQMLRKLCPDIHDVPPFRII
jgi:hypothetical protein